jgi:deoxyribose-phosphate aldolase
VESWRREYNRFNIQAIRIYLVHEPGHWCTALKHFSPCRYIESKEALLSMIDNTNLQPMLTIDEAEDFAIRSFEEGFHCAMLPPHHAEILADRGYGRYGRLCTVFCFPHPYYSTESCVRALKTVLKTGIAEVDIVAPLHLVKAGEW